MESTAESLDRVRRRSYENVKKSLTVNDIQCGERAWCRAHRIVTRVLLAGWRALADVRVSAHAIHSGERSATAPLRDPKSSSRRPVASNASSHHQLTMLRWTTVWRILPETTSFLLTILPHSPLPPPFTPSTYTAHTLLSHQMTRRSAQQCFSCARRAARARYLRPWRGSGHWGFRRACAH